MGRIRDVASLLSPEFVERDGLVVRAAEAGCAEINRGAPIDATGLEALCTHLHVFDHFVHDAEVIDELPDDAGPDDSVYDSAHPDFVAAISIGLAAAWGWSISLRRTFPDYRFRVYYTELDNPIVRCHRVRPGEQPWISDDEVRDIQLPDRVMVVDTATMTAVWSKGFDTEGESR